MDDTDRKLMNLIQEEIPLVERPFEELGHRLGITGKEALERIARMNEEDRFRRIGPSFAPRKIGYTSTLVAARVPRRHFDETVEYINRHIEITHNYERDDYFNVWFTIIAHGSEAIEAIIQDIKDNTGVEEILDLPATHIFKIQVQFDVDNGDDGTD